MGKDTTLNWHAVNGTPIVWLTILCVILAQFAVTYSAPLQEVFATTSVAFVDVLLIVGIGVVLFVVLEFEKRLRGR
ncbi:cation transporting ATPase C-terminal domain-containing protein [Pseudidiomarina salilacus]|uniref:cation transporting ATPase C-terminal domain-containing protein n=1 Tax=Pseudidiomarina salilacus TaxID=3384452 RepID=UPI003984C41B